MALYLGSEKKSLSGGTKLIDVDALDMRCNNTLTSYSSDNVTNVNQYALYACTKLKSVSLPNAVTIGNNAFDICIALTDVHIPAATTIGGSAFSSCNELSFLDLPSATSIGSGAFYICPKLSTLVLRSSTVCELKNENAFNSTPFASGGTGGTVYVPSSLIASYQTASNWSTLYNAGTCNFVAIEGSEYE